MHDDPTIPWKVGRWDKATLALIISNNSINNSKNKKNHNNNKERMFTNKYTYRHACTCKRAHTFSNNTVLYNVCTCTKLLIYLLLAQELVIGSSTFCIMA